MTMNRIARIGQVVLCCALLGIWVGEAEAQEVLEQWVLAVVGASSYPITTAGSSGQVLGPPQNICELEDFRFLDDSWRTLEPDAGVEWIEVRFAQPVHAFAVEVYETLNPGAVVAISVRDESGAWQSVWEGEDSTQKCPGVLKAQFTSLPFSTNEVRITLDTSLIPGWNQIDAVKLMGYQADRVEVMFEEVPTEKIFKPEEGMEAPGWMNPYTFGDYDNDGWPDLFSWGGRGYFTPFTLLHNEGDGTFGNREPLLPLRLHGGSNAGWIFGDYDNDGDLDLFIPNGSVIKSIYGPDMLWRNDGGQFTDVSMEAGFSDSLVSGAAAWWDYDRDGWLDLFVEHGSSNDAVVEAGGTTTNTLYRNNGNGTFSDMTEVAGLDIDWQPEYLNLGTSDEFSTVDFDEDGWPDLFVAVVGGEDRLFLNNGKGRFIDVTSGDIGAPGPTVGVVTGDIDGDGDLDLFRSMYGVAGVTTAWGERSAMLLNLGGGQFLDVTENVGLTPVVTTTLTFARFWDIDNDGDLDLITSGPFMLFLNAGDGTFTEGTFIGGLSGGYVAGDYDNDGFLDIWVDQFFFRNRGNDNHYLRIDLVGTESNRDGIGARLYATTGGRRQTREFSGGSGWLQDERMVHFGLGEHAQVDQLEIRWPSGQIDLIDDIPADQEIRVIEGRGRWYPAPRTVWTVEPPHQVIYGQEVEFVAEVRPAMFEPRAEISSITADLSSLGGPEKVSLKDLGDGTYRLETRFAVGGRAELRDVEVFIEQSTPLGRHWINLSRNIVVQGDPNTAVTEAFAETLPQTFVLDQNYPNPFNSSTVIRFALPFSTDVELSVYNLTGQQVATLADGTRQAGVYTIRWDGRDDHGLELASGVYLYRLQTSDGTQVKTRKLLLLR